ncbi:hypothetical protein QE422_003954 [Chryseobacterium sp. SORGH_AS 447]|uniref:DUF6705 family protein n=1 Tax=Chryseobacterium sp. SORGH_AS_0447 TaxID=3041769 RepID=UPI0027833EBC|nr:DUF6705 family protein [Chryseobacterium sp. SORGH_AS_0447]MDQ1163586.1 hypothetical protein [Chryseobacterium sp. SORGH_AS_0447]
MKNTLFLIALIISLISCKGQQLPLNTFMDDIPSNAHVKDLNNELNPYVGIYKANYQGEDITLYITKVNDKLEERSNKNFYRDALVIKYIVKNSSGIVLQDTQNNNIPNIELYSTRIRSYDNSVIFYYSGTNCRVGWGNVYIKKINATQISWLYQPNDRVILPGQCPGNPDLKIYLPETENPLIFTKQ